MSFWNDCFVCAACGTTISGEIALAQHCQGKAHFAMAGFRGFAGLRPNEAGIEPKPSQICIDACGGAGGRSNENLASVGLTVAAQDIISGALTQNREAGLMGDSDDEGDEAAPTDGREPRARQGRNRSSVPDLRPPPAIAHRDAMGPMGDQRRNLPVYSFKKALLDAIQDNHVIVVEGETGSGKTTQVPQYVLEDAAARGVPGNIIIAQPRRISAMSVAERVAAERGDAIGQTVGYTIRLESKATTNTRLLFCTTGILLKRLEEDPSLQNVTHVFVDEVHERSIESDFLLMVLKDLLPKRPASNPLKVILMSATLDASLFHDYFWGAPLVKFPGRTFPVQEIYLEDILEITGHQLRGNEDWCRKGNFGGGGGGGGGNPNQGGRGNQFVPEKRPPSLQEKDDEHLTPEELSQRYSKYSPNTQMVLSRLDHNAIDYALVVQTITFLASLATPSDAASYLDGKQGNPGARSSAGGGNTENAILVFLPGIKEITTVQEMLTMSPAFRQEPARSWVLPIHSTIPPEEQRLVFTRPPPGVRKVVLATNIAETAITIDDVAFVVDTGRMKENRYDPLKRMSSLEDCLVSRANARQRRGRAGRVREGVAVHLFTRHRHDMIANYAQPPEVQRVPLEQLVLRIKALKYEGTAAEVCARLVEPPTPAAVSRAVEELVFLEALKVGKEVEGGETLTALGVHLSTLPVDCRIGKLILLGAMFGVADEALTIAATLSYRSPFQAPMMKRDEADRAKMQFATGQSDHLTMLNAYQTVDKMGHARYDFCRENFLSIKTLQTIAGLKRQFLELLSASGFVRQGLRSRAVEAMGRRGDGSDGVRIALEQGLNGGGGRGGQQMQDGQMFGDWTCGNVRCQGNNFARNTACFRCKAPKPQSVEAADGSNNNANGQMAGDWTCTNEQCKGNNFGRNIMCFRCKAPKPPQHEVHAEEAPKGGRWGEENDEEKETGDDKFDEDAEKERKEPLLKVRERRACQ
jgi:ATP-dependent RNA helicase DHX57